MDNFIVTVIIVITGLTSLTTILLLAGIYSYYMYQLTGGFPLLLKPDKCPHCGDKNTKVKKGLNNKYWVECKKCGTIGGKGNSNNQAVLKWNRRKKRIK